MGEDEHGSADLVRCGWAGEQEAPPEIDFTGGGVLRLNLDATTGGESAGH